MALGTITVQVNALTSNAYGSFSAIVIQSYYYCSARLGNDIELTSGTVGTNAVTTNDNEGMAVAQLAASLLANGKLHSKPDGVPLSIDDLFTAEIRDLLLTPDELDESQMAKGIMWDNSLPVDNAEKTWL